MVRCTLSKAGSAAYGQGRLICCRAEGDGVPALETFLHRLRIHGVPGAPGSAGVPADRVAEVTAELEPIFELLEETQRRVEQVVARGEREAARSRARGSDEAKTVVADARAQAEAQRAEAAATTLERSADERRTILAEARAEVGRVDRVIVERMPSVRAELVRRVLHTGSSAP
jgi:uncharacterized membrane protein YqiK